MMALEEMRPYLGRRCHVVVRSRACGGRHTRYGRLVCGQCAGDLVLAGVVYSPDEVVSVRAAECRNERGGVVVPMSWVLSTVAFAAGLSGWLQLVHH
jgi:hypothetical protein